MKNSVVGRQEEKKLLTKRLLSKEPEFIAVHGRRRVGKKGFTIALLMSTHYSTLSGLNQYLIVSNLRHLNPIIVSQKLISSLEKLGKICF